MKKLVSLALVLCFAGCGTTFREEVIKKRKGWEKKAKALYHEMAPADVEKIMGSPEQTWTEEKHPEGYSFPSDVKEIWAWGVDLPFGIFRRSVVEVNFTPTPAGNLRAWQIYVNGQRKKYHKK